MKFQFFLLTYTRRKKIESEGLRNEIDRKGIQMIGLLIIATTLMTRGVNNMQEAAFLFAAPPVALANYTYYFLEKAGFNYTEVMNSLPTVPDTLFDTEYWLSPTTLSSMRNTTEYLIREMPMKMTEVPKTIYERLLPSRPTYVSSSVDIGMVFVGMYMVSLFTLATIIWLMKPGAKQEYEEFDGADNILVRKRKRVPQGYYDEGRMQLRSMTTDKDVFYALE
jgi:hypothetical protein